MGHYFLDIQYNKWKQRVKRRKKLLSSEKLPKIRQINGTKMLEMQVCALCTNDPAVIQGQPITLHLYVKYATNGNMRVFFSYARLSTDPLHFVEVITS